MNTINPDTVRERIKKLSSQKSMPLKSIGELFLGRKKEVNAESLIARAQNKLSGSVPIKISEIFIIAKKLGVSALWLCGLSEDTKPTKHFFSEKLFIQKALQDITHFRIPKKTFGENIGPPSTTPSTYKYRYDAFFSGQTSITIELFNRICTFFRKSPLDYFQ